MFFTDRCTLKTVTENVDDFLNEIAVKLRELIPHDFIWRSQALYFKTTKENLKKDEFLVISDFSENYTFVVQDEIQAFHWTNEQCTLHPFSIYYRSENEERMISYVVIAESLEHNIVSVYLFQTKLFAFLKNKFNSIKKIYFFSDGSAAQYKNKKNFYNLCEMKQKHGFEAEWHFFATYHGKSPCDALGGTIKRMATRASLRNVKDQILSAKDLFEFVKCSSSVINTVLCTKVEHDSMAALLEDKYNDVKTIPGTQKFHAFTPVSGTFSLHCKRISASSKSSHFNLIKKTRK